MNAFSKKGFYIYKNYCYSLDFTDNVKVFGKVVDIKNDSLYITNSLNFATAKKRNINYDTLKYSIKQIKTLRLITGEIDGYSKNIDLQNYSRQLVKTECCDGTSKVIYREDPQIYTKKDTLVQSKKTNVTVTTLKTKKGNEAMTDCYPYLVNDGIVYIYENEGLIYIVNSWAPGK